MMSECIGCMFFGFLLGAMAGAGILAYALNKYKHKTKQQGD